MGNIISRKKISKINKKYCRNESVASVKEESLRNITKQQSESELTVKKTKLFLRTLYSYEAIDLNDLSFNVNDLLMTEEDITNKNWFKAKNIRTNEVGMVPFNYVRIEDGSPSSYEFYYDVNRVEAERLLQLMSNPNGTFLIRPSTNKPNLALSVRSLDSNAVWAVRHFVIHYNEDKWFLVRNQPFETIMELINYYKKDNLQFNTKLTQPLPRDQKPPIHFQQMEVSRNNFYKVDIVGRGNFGEVWKARWGQNSNHLVAVKIVQSNMMSNEQFLSEAKIIHSLRHPRIVELLGVCTEPESEPIYIITEYMSEGALLNFLRSTKGKSLTFKRLLDIVAQVCEGMEYLEKKSYIHRDLRAANILVDTHYFVKVADFGLARVIQQDEDAYNATESKFPVRWTAPEAALEGIFSTKSDVWSFGVLLYEIVTYGCTPYANLSTKEVLSEIIKNNYRLENPHGLFLTGCTITCTQPLYNIMLNCWHNNPETRPTFASLVGFFSNWDISTEGQYEDQ